MILNPAQAEAVYGAMCALNNVGANATVRIPNSGTTIHVTQRTMGDAHLIQVFIADAVGNPTGNGFEEYAAQATFAAAYGLN